MLFALQNVTKTYGRITALRQLSVEAPAGAVGLLGPNGAGKTTLIRTLLGLIAIDAGQLTGMSRKDAITEFVLTLRQQLRGRRLLVLSLLFLLPAVLAGVFRFVPYPPTPDVLEFALIFNLIPHALAPLTALLYAAGALQDEIEE